MVDLGTPFSRPYKELIDALEQSIREGVEQPVQERLIFQSSATAYELRYPAATITRVTGLVGGKSFTVFQPGVHYRFSNNRILWLHGTEKPVDGGRLEVEYTYRERPAGLTDFNPGSVIGTLVRAVARELKLLYEQMDQAYRRAFIDEASGVALDNVVALLGVVRNPAIKAQGRVTFFVKAATNRNLPIPVNTRVADESGRLYITTQPALIEPVITEATRLVDGAIKVTNRIAELEGIWPRPASSSAPTGDPPVVEKTAGLARSEDERTLLFGQVEPSIRDALTAAGGVWVRYKSKSVTVPVEALTAGPEGNVNSGAVVIMPTPPSGIDGVVNEAPITGGQSPEADDQLRERAKHELERSGNATLNALKFAVLDVDGVEGVEVVDHSSDNTIPLGEVHVRYSGGNPSDVERVVEQTRAAGILAKLQRINEVMISGLFYLLPDPPTPATAAESFVAAVVAALRQQAIGQTLSVRRLNALAYGIGGLAEVAEAQLRFKKANLREAGQFIEGDVVDPFLIDRAELVRPDQARLSARVLTTVRAQRAAGTKLDLELGLLDATGNPALFKNFVLDLSITLRAHLLNAPDQPPETVGRFTFSATFVNQASVTLTIDPATHAPQLRREGADQHDINQPIQVTVSAAAFPGLQPAQNATVDFSPEAAPIATPRRRRTRKT